MPGSRGGRNFSLKRSENWQRIPLVNATMGQVLKFRCNDVFFPEVTVSMREAYDAAIATLPPDARSVFYFRERIAKRIMKAALPEKLTESNCASRVCLASAS